MAYDIIEEVENPRDYPVEKLADEIICRMNYQDNPAHARNELASLRWDPQEKPERFFDRITDLLSVIYQKVDRRVATNTLLMALPRDLRDHICSLQKEPELNLIFTQMGSRHIKENSRPRDREIRRDYPQRIPREPQGLPTIQPKSTPNPIMSGNIGNPPPNYVPVRQPMNDNYQTGNRGSRNEGYIKPNFGQWREPRPYYPRPQEPATTTPKAITQGPTPQVGS